MHPILFNYFTLNFNMIFTRPKNDTLLRFVKIGDINNYKIYNKTNYLIISYNKNENNNNNYSIYNYIRNNNKPLFLINNEKDTNEETFALRVHYLKKIID